MLAQLSIRAKLFAVLSFLLVIIAITGTVAFLQMRAMNNATQDIQTSWLPSVRLLGEMRTRSAQHRAIMRDFLLDNSPGAIAETSKLLAGRAADYQVAWKAYQPLITSEQERALVTEMEATASAYILASDEVKALAQSNPADARERYVRKALPAGRAMEAVLAKLVDLNDAGATAAGNLAEATYVHAVKWMIAIVAIAILLALVAGLYLARDIARGIGSILTPMGRLTNGDLSAPIPALAPTTEIGRIAKALQIFKEALIANKAADDAASAQSRKTAERAIRISEVTARFEGMIGDLVDSLSSASTELEASATQMTRTSDMTMTLSGSAASASQSVSTNIQTVAAATEEITSSVNEIGRQVSESTRVAQVAVSQAEKTNQSVTRLADATVRIDHVVKLITEVAEQTNLLALNATIEAARAGDAGRGFAVVASEVKALSSQTAKATDEIRTQIADMQAASREAVETIKEIGATILTISEVSAAIAAAVEQQGAATQEIARNVQQSANFSTQVANEVEQVSRGSSESGAASAQVLSAAQSLSSESARLKIEVDQFLATVRAV